MKKILLAGLLGVSPLALAKLPPTDAARIADAIYLIEGGPKARVPYGILTVKVRGAAGARAVCLRTIQNNHDRWLAAGRPGSYTDFLGDRYCPKAADPVGNANWKRNIRAKLSK